jgi:hypothetical protein
MPRLSVVKMSVNFSHQVVSALRALAKKRGVTMTEVLRQAIGTEVFLDEQRNRGGRVLVEDRRGRVRELVIR